MQGQKRNVNLPKKSLGIAEDMEKLKQRREDRKTKVGEDKKEGVCTVDSHYEKLMKKKKIEFDLPSDNV